MMISHAKSVLGDINKVYPDYDPSQGYTLKGFVWFQGENDFGGDSYPNAGQPGGFDEYSRLLACLIRDLRKELDAPDMNAVIGVLGFNGELETRRFRQIEDKHTPWLREFRKAMAQANASPSRSIEPMNCYPNRSPAQRESDFGMKYRQPAESIAHTSQNFD